MAIGLGRLRVAEVKALVEAGRSELGIRDDSRCPIHMDAPAVSETVRQFMDPILLEYGRQVNQDAAENRTIVTGTEEISDLTNERQVSQSVRASVAADASIPDLVAPFIITKEQGIPASVSNRWIDKNLQLIRIDGKGTVPPIPKQHFKEMTKILDLGIRRNVNHVDLARQLRHLDGVTARRARTLAIDQLGSYHGRMAEIRHRQMGVSGYFWSTQGDGKVRPDHQAREGVRFEYSKPPSDGHPSQAIRCRCWATPDIRSSIGLEPNVPQRGFRVTGDPKENALSAARGRAEAAKRTARSTKRAAKEARSLASASVPGSRGAATKSEALAKRAARAQVKAEAAVSKLV